MGAQVKYVSSEAKSSLFSSVGIDKVILSLCKAPLLRVLGQADWSTCPDWTSSA